MSRIPGIAAHNELAPTDLPVVQFQSDGTASNHHPVGLAQEAQSGSGINYLSLQPQEIRLLVLLPGIEGDAIRCNLIHTNTDWEGRKRDSGSEYEAISYMWGPSEPTEVIVIDGHDIIIRYNLWLALKSIRSQESARIIWVDALCINQNDIPERSAQVLRMSQIYKNASKVIVWLGSQSDDSDAIFDFMEGEQSHIKNLIEELAEGSSRSTFEGGYILKYTLKAAFIALCYRDYWRRVWIIQEIISAKNLEIVCGAKKISWQKFDQILELLDSSINYQYSYSDFARTCQRSPAFLIGSHKRRNNIGSTLKELIQLCFDCNSECVDVRDRVYGLLGVAIDDVQVTPDYSKTTLQIFYDLLQWTAAFANDTTSDSPNSEWIGFVQILQRILGNPLRSTSLDGLVSPINLGTIRDIIIRLEVYGIVEHVDPEVYQYGTAPEADSDKHTKVKRTLPASLREKEISQWAGNAKLIEDKKYKEDLASLSRLSVQDHEMIHCVGKRFYSSDFNLTEVLPTSQRGIILNHSRTNQQAFFSEDKIYSHPNRDARQYRTFFTPDMWGIAWHNVQKGDYLCGLINIEGVTVVLRPHKESEEIASFLLISRALILRNQRNTRAFRDSQIQFRVDLNTLLSLLS